jgi:hypothetical protein
MNIVQLLSDVVVAHALQAALSVLLLVGASAKLRDLGLFRAHIENYQLLPEALAAPAAAVLAVWELACGMALLLAPDLSITRAATVALLLVVTGAVAINLLRGRTDIDCGCAGLSGTSGQSGEQRLSWALVLRNALLLLALFAATAGHAERTLVWLDYLSVAGTTLALLGLYVAAGQLLVNHPRLQAIKRS